MADKMIQAHEARADAERLKIEKLNERLNWILNDVERRVKIAKSDSLFALEYFNKLFADKNLRKLVVKNLKLNGYAARRTSWSRNVIWIRW